MPELPEVETIKNGLSRFILFKKIKDIELLDQKLFNKNKKELLKLKNDQFSDISRLGKAIIFSFLKSKNKLIIHLKMTGQIIYFKSKKQEALIAGGHSEKKQNTLDISDFKHIRLKINFADKSFLILNDTRRFGYLKQVSQKEFLDIKNKIGIEPLGQEFNLKYFLDLTRNKKKNIKAFLLDQKYVLGIGNIYADEILFASKVSPFKGLDKLKIEDKNNIFKNIKKILKLAIEKRGTTFSDYIDADGNSGGFLKLLKVYSRQNQECKICKNPIKKTKLAGRGTHYCSKCQK